MRKCLGVGALLGLCSIGCGGGSAGPAGPTPVSGPASFTSSTVGAVVGVTQVTFTATGSTTLTYSWNFGDGASATGNPANHIYMAEGQFVPVLKASDGTSGQTTITVKSLSGTWGDVQTPGSFQWSLTQSGGTLTGTDSSNSASLQGTISTPRKVSVSEGGMLLTGKVEEGLDSMSLSFNTPSGPQEVRLLRQ
jgi:hypothetical protein